MSSIEMTKVEITKEAFQAVMRRAEFPLDARTTRQLASGMVEIELSWDTLHRLEDYVWKGESLSDTILRVCKTAGRKVQ